MSGSKLGGKLAAAKNLATNPQFYKLIGKRGGQSSNNGGFASEVVSSDGLTGRERARLVGAIGGKKSRRKSKIAKV